MDGHYAYRVSGGETLDTQINWIIMIGGHL